jgi:hypothetical protein
MKDRQAAVARPDGTLSTLTSRGHRHTLRDGRQLIRQPTDRIGTDGLAQSRGCIPTRPLYVAPDVQRFVRRIVEKGHEKIVPILLHDFLPNRPLSRQMSRKSTAPFTTGTPV